MIEAMFKKVIIPNCTVNTVNNPKILIIGVQRLLQVSRVFFLEWGILPNVLLPLVKSSVFILGSCSISINVTINSRLTMEADDLRPKEEESLDHKSDYMNQNLQKTSETFHWNIC